MIRESGAPNAFRFTSALTDGENLYAVRYAQPRETANTLYYRDTAAISSSPPSPSTPSAAAGTRFRRTMSSSRPPTASRGSSRFSRECAPQPSEQGAIERHKKPLQFVSAG